MQCWWGCIQSQSVARGPLAAGKTRFMFETFTVEAQAACSCLQKEECLFSANHSTQQNSWGHVPTLSKVTHGTTSTFTKRKKNPSDSCWQLIELTLFFCAYPCCHSPVYWHYISWKPPRDCIITLTGDSTVLLQHWLTFCISTLEQRLHWLLLR